MIRFSRFISLGVLGLLYATSAYGQIDCPAIKRNVNNILSIGPWQSSKVAIITTDLQLFEVTLPSETSNLNQRNLNFQLDSPTSLATTEPALYGALKQQHPKTFTSADTLIQVNSPAALQRYVLLANRSGYSWLINPLNGESRRLGQAQFLSDGSTWCSSDSLTFYAINGKWIQIGACVLGKQPHIRVNTFVKYWEYYEADSVKTVDQPSHWAPNWNVKKAFTYQKHFYVLTPETVYIFSDGEVFHSTVSVSYSKVPYEKFFTCKETKKQTKDDQSKGKVTHAHSAHSSSPRSSTKWLIIDIALGVVFLLLAVLGTFYLCRGKATSKEEPESKGSPSQREKPRPQKRRKSTATFGQGTLVKGPKRSRASPFNMSPPSVASKLVAPKSNALGLKKVSSSRQVPKSNSKIASSWKTEGKLG